ncbi:peptidylprolyl isomerase [Patescibacteria group bacterium]
MKKTLAMLFVSMFVLVGCNGPQVQVGLTTTSDTDSEAKPFTEPVVTEPVEEDSITTDTMSDNRHAVIQTNLGTMELELFEQRAPITTKNFIDLAEKGFYDGIIFHRIIEDFMVQGGDPDGTGFGGPGYMIEDEFHPELTHSGAGIMSMANSGPDTGGSQFFITLEATTWLDGKHAVFGKIVKGMDTLEDIGNAKTDSGDRPLEEIVMEKVTIK